MWLTRPRRWSRVWRLPRRGSRSSRRRPVGGDERAAAPGIESMAERREAELAAERAERRRLELEVADLRRRSEWTAPTRRSRRRRNRSGRRKRKAKRRAVLGAGFVRRSGSRAGSRATLVRGWSRTGRRRRTRPAECSSCQGDLAGSEVLTDGWAQVWNLLDALLEKLEWVLPQRRCACCGKVTAAAGPGVRHAGPGLVSYGPRLHAAAVLLASEGHRRAAGRAGLSRVRRPRERTARPGPPGCRLRRGDEDGAARRADAVRRRVPGQRAAPRPRRGHRHGPVGQPAPARDPDPAARAGLVRRDRLALVRGDRQHRDPHRLARLPAERLFDSAVAGDEPMRTVSAP
ncbi:hypothetical protein FRACA_2970001 [Frankia canadensis]|uniref:Uncharacterized protein n=1 Tax=Frankia canadensis TaxID=1836972 RepID=A0A2I2KTJ2_9ACTN|nr:hypothetical protein FRACA_2970001 [Frankia canadensis]SOU56265.1 hypothetical protein FRACA_2970001 [Frankia canadensis]